VRPNPLKTLFRENRGVLSGFLSIDSSYSAEIIGHCGYDAVVVDLQHAPIYLDKAVPMLQALSSTGAVPLARCSANHLFEINRLLDGGAYGIICPMVNTPDEARRFVQACMYPPMGNRSYGPTRGLTYGGADYYDHANDTLVTLAMIETREGLDNLAEICRVPGLDGILVGPSDLSIALGGRPNAAWDSGPLGDALHHIVATCRSESKVAGIVCASTAFAIDMKRAGWGFIVVGTDSGLLRQVATEAVATVRAA